MQESDDDGRVVLTSEVMHSAVTRFLHFARVLPVFSTVGFNRTESS